MEKVVVETMHHKVGIEMKLVLLVRSFNLGIKANQFYLRTENISLLYYILIQSHFVSFFNKLTNTNYLNAPFSSNCHVHEKSFPLLAASDKSRLAEILRP